MEDFLISLGFSASTIAALKLATLGRLLLASLLGGLIGLERELSGKPAGLRTNLLICVGATLLTELSLSVAGLAAGTTGGVRGDPARIAAQIVPGIGFLGAGTILHSRGHVTGLTTAATLWVVAAIGMAIGTGAYTEAVGTTSLVFITLVLLAKAEKLLARRRTSRRYRLVVAHAEDAVPRVERTFVEAGLEAKLDSVEKEDGTLHAVFKATGSQRSHDEAVRRLIADEGVRRVGRV